MPVRKAKLERAGITILQDYLTNNPLDTRPSPATTKSLLEQIQRAQNNNEIKMRTVNEWFRRRRTCREQHQSAKMSATPTSPFSGEYLRILYTLVQDTPDPTLNVLEAWAKLFNVSIAILQYAITVVLPQHFPSAPLKVTREERVAASDTSSPSASRGPLPDLQRLLTPADSLTPEPSAVLQRSRCTNSPEYLKNELSSPTLPSTSLHSTESHYTSGFQDDMRTRASLPFGGRPATSSSMDHLFGLQPSPPPTPVVSTAKPELKSASTPRATTDPPEPVFNPRLSPIQNAIFTGVQKACVEVLSTQHRARPPPSTTQESDARFTPYQASLERLLRLLEAYPSSSFYNPAAKNHTPNF